MLGGFTFSSAPIFSNVNKPTQQEEVAKAETKPNPFSNFTFGTPQTTTEQKTPAKSSILTGLLSTPSILSTLTPKSTTSKLELHNRPLSYAKIRGQLRNQAKVAK